ncbi:hypothetical protein V2J09_004705 [Rumex salicifolius]
MMPGTGRANGNGEKEESRAIDLEKQRLFMEKKGNYVNMLSWREMDSLTALCDTFLPSVNPPNDAVRIPRVVTVDDPTVKFFNTSASMAGTPDYIGGLISQRLRSHVFLTRLTLFFLSTWIGTLILCGKSSLSSKYPFFHKFSELDHETRQKITISWSSSCIKHLRMLFLGIKSLILLAFFTQVDDNNENPSWKAIGYCGPDPDFQAQSTETPKSPPSSLEDMTFGPLHRCFVNMSSPRETVAQSLRLSGFQVSVHPQSPKKPAMTIRCDAVVVGSGSGGGVVAGVLAKAGYKVLVIEKGTYIARQNLSLLEGQSLDQMYEFGGILPTRDVNVMILAGSTVGGGSTINWSASIKTPSHVMREWSEEYDLELFDSKLYKEALDVVCEKMDVQESVEEEGINNEVLRRGCVELGYPVENIPRNAPKDHYCGWCFMGCKDGRKKGTVETWLRDLVDSKNGVILPNCEALKVLYSTRPWCGGRGKAKGVAFTYDYKGAREMCVVESKVTIVACGALNTPVLLKRSGLRNPNIGRNLHLHPVTMAWGHFAEDLEAQTEAWRWQPPKGKTSYEGGIMTAMSSVVADSKKPGYGALIQTPSLHPGLFSALMPWTSGIDIKVRMTKFSRTAHLLALLRDQGSGEISPQNAADIQYNLSNADEANLKRGLEKMLRILAAAGAEEIGTHHTTGPRLNVKTASSHEFERFIKKVSSMGLQAQSAPLASAHQMGSCRMGVEPKTSAVDQRGETWEVEGLYVADTSVFPTALGVNPMVTAMAISYCTAQAVVEVLKRKKMK